MTFTLSTETGDQSNTLLEQEAASKGMEALWRGSKLEVESVLREVCDRVLEPSVEELEEQIRVSGGGATSSIDADEVKRRRCMALSVLGEVYQKASK